MGGVPAGPVPSRPAGTCRRRPQAPRRSALPAPHAGSPPAAGRGKAAREPPQRRAVGRCACQSVAAAPGALLCHGGGRWRRPRPPARQAEAAARRVSKTTFIAIYRFTAQRLRPQPCTEQGCQRGWEVVIKYYKNNCVSLRPGGAEGSLPSQN